MNHKITTTITGDEWKQTMVCEFANSAIAKLVLEDTSTGYHGHKLCLLASGEAKAELQHEGKVVTVTCRKHNFVRRWHSDPNANKDTLEALAKDWEAQEQAWLPIRRYFMAGIRKFQNEFDEWIKNRDEEVGGLAHQIKELERKLEHNAKFQESQVARLRGKLLEVNKEIRDIHDCLEMDTNQIKGLRVELALHKKQTFHFLGGKK